MDSPPRGNAALRRATVCRSTVRGAHENLAAQSVAAACQAHDSDLPRRDPGAALKAQSSPKSRVPLTFVELPSRPLAPHQVRVRVAAAGVNPVDWKMREYEFLGIAQRILGPRGPVVVGIDVAGTVTEIGAAVTDFAVGDRVVGGTDFQAPTPRRSRPMFDRSPAGKRPARIHNLRS